MEKIFKKLDKFYASKDGNLSQSEVDRIIAEFNLGTIPLVRTVLIVDDAAFIRKVEREILTENGYMVIAEAEDGQEAIEMYKQHHPDLVIMNITMPVMNGIEATKEIIRFDKGAKIIMLSGISNYQTVKESLLAGACNFIVEKFEMSHFSAILRPKEQKETAKTASEEKLNTVKKETIAAKKEAPRREASINNLWKSSFEAVAVRSPRAIIGEQAALLKTLTNSHVIAVLAGTKKAVGEEKSFKYEFNITSPKLSGYIYPVFTVAYDVPMYPCSLYIKEEITKELKIPAEMTVTTEGELSKALEKILKSKVIDMLVSSLLALAKEEESTPFL